MQEDSALRQAGHRPMLHEEFEIPEELAHPLPSEGADLDPLASLIGAIGNIGNETFLVQASHCFTHGAHANRQRGQQCVARQDRVTLFVQEI